MIEFEKKHKSIHLFCYSLGALGLHIYHVYATWQKVPEIISNASIVT